MTSFGQDSNTDKPTFHERMLAEWIRELAGEVAVVTLQRLPLVLSLAEILVLLDAATEPLERLAWRTLYCTGLRPAELLALHSDHLRGDDLLVGERVVAIDSRTLKRLRELGPGGLFPWSPEELNARFAACGERTGLAARFRGSSRVLLPTALRHAFATHRMGRGMDLLSLKNLLGHELLRTTELYFNCSISYCRPDYDRYHMLVGTTEPGLENGRELTGDFDPFVELVIDLEPEEAERGNQAAALEFDEVMLLKNSAKTLRDRLMIRFLYATGLRKLEMSLLRFSDIDYDEGRVFVRNGKGDEDRYELMDAGTSAALRAYQGSTPVGELVLGIGHDRINEIITKLGKSTGLAAKYAPRSVSPHSLRHSYATHCYRRGMSMQMLRQLLGHSYYDTTEAYVDGDSGDWKKAYARTGEELPE